MGNHDNQMILRHLLQKLHDLFAGVAVQSAGRLIREHNRRMVHQSARDRHPLHLPSGQLRGFLPHLFFQTNTVKLLLRPDPAFFRRNAGENQGKLHIPEQGLMGNQIIALKNKANRVVAVRIPIAASISGGRHTVDHQLPAVTMIQSAYNIEQSCFPGTAGSQDRNEFIFPKRQ